MLRDPLLRLWLAVVQPHREAFELGRGEQVLAAAAERIAASQQTTFRGVARDWLAERTGLPSGAWWDRAGRAVVDVVALDGAGPVAAAAAHWARGIDGVAIAERVRAALASGGLPPPDEVAVLARSGTAVVTPADLLGDH